jgi:hypothetical protein
LSLTIVKVENLYTHRTVTVNICRIVTSIKYATAVVSAHKSIIISFFPANQLSMTFSLLLILLKTNYYVRKRTLTMLKNTSLLPIVFCA